MGGVFGYSITMQRAFLEAAQIRSTSSSGSGTEDSDSGRSSREYSKRDSTGIGDGSLKELERETRVRSAVQEKISTSDTEDDDGGKVLKRRRTDKEGCFSDRIRPSGVQEDTPFWLIHLDEDLPGQMKLMS